MKVLITGGKGFIGKNLSEQLSAKHEIDAPGSSELDLLDAAAVRARIKSGGFDAVVHCAWWNSSRNSKKDLSRSYVNNVAMFENVANCSEYFGKMIYFGSGAEYSKEHYMPRMKEDYFGKFPPFNDDSHKAKYRLMEITLGNPKIINLRTFAVFGKYEDWEIRFISNAICKALFSLPITIKQNVYYDYMHVDDLVSITDWFLAHEPAEQVYNTCTSAPVDLLTLARMITELSNKKLEIIISREGLGREYSGDNSRLLSEMGGFKFSDIREKITGLYRWYEERKGSIDPAKLLTDK